MFDAAPAESFLLTGVTGFVGQSVLERLLVTTDAQVYVLVRGRGDVSAADRFAAICQGPLLSVWRQEHGDEFVDAQVAQRCHVLEGDLSDLPSLPWVDVVLHSASCVQFDAPADLAVEANVVGPANLYKALQDGGQHPRIVHISTCYVQASRTSEALEVPVDHQLRWRDEVRKVLARKSALKAAGMSADDISADLQEFGLAHARSHGFTDIYTLTKTLGEAVAQEMWQDHDLTIVRPSIVEPSIAYPFPGWIDGFKVIEPLIAQYCKGRMNVLPGVAKAILDVVPVDIVSAVVVKAALTVSTTGHTRYVHVATGSDNPITLGQYAQNMHDYFVANPFRDVKLSPWRFMPPSVVRAQFRAAGYGLRAVKKVTRSRTSARALRWNKTAARHARQVAIADKMGSLYGPYTNSTTAFRTDVMRQLVGPMVEGIDWHHYTHEVHFPAVVRMMSEHAGAAVSVRDMESAQSSESPSEQPT